MSAQEPPALPGEVWRGVVTLSWRDGDQETVCAIVGADVCGWTRGGWKSLTPYTAIRACIFRAAFLAERARVADLERDLAEYCAADRAGKDTV